MVAVDGPSGVGKGTLCRGLAAHYGWHLLDSGALYRLTALAALRRGVPLDRENDLAAVAAALDVRFDSDGHGRERVCLQGEDVSAELRSETCGNAASKIAVLPAVRDALLERQRAFRRPPGLVADGRDMGTVVFPTATVKLFLTASPEKRAKRRYKQLIEKGIGASLAALVREIAERDERDARRAVAPLRPADDAVTLDTSELDIAAVQRRARQIIDAKLACR